MRDEATQRQIDAADPGRSTWLSANAGSGKTRVLTDRVARLLLERTDPQNILCLTYTKAAASEMQNRLFQRLGEWAMLDELRLTDALTQLGVEGALPPDRLKEARRLFASAIETPGGLKIQTIHSFCSGLLRQFPLEAGVTPQFQEMDERSASLLRAEIVEEMGAGPDAPLLQEVARYYTGENFDSLTAEIIRHRAAFLAPLDEENLARCFALPADIGMDQILASVFTGGETALLERLVPALLASGTMDRKAGEKLARITELDMRALGILEEVLLTGKGAASPFSAKLGSFPTKACRAGIAAIIDRLEALMLRVEANRDVRLSYAALEKTRHLHAFAKRFLPAYDHAKQRQGWLDFDDLILRARDLLNDPAVAAWVLFRLDGRIDHILVDEAQDTSPAQWQVIEQLAQEFTSGEGARADTKRTIFVVGDKKQSIYSFQGADPREFDRMQADFADRLRQTETPLNETELEYSFRSSQAILSLVDASFKTAEKSGFTLKQSHKAFKSALPGRVDLWPYIDPPEKEEKPPWHMPVDTKAANDPGTQLAQRIATTIKELIDQKHPIPDSDARAGLHNTRAVTAGDFLILVQRRSDLFYEIIRACKMHDLPIGGADRLKVGAEIAVRDLAALLSFLATPEDSYALAVALKSPLLGWSEADLYHLAHPRKATYLWEELRRRGDDFPQTMEMLHDLRRVADFLRPYDLIERILTRHDGRRRLLGRLGHEAEEGIDALLAQAMIYEQKSVDSLTGFLVWLETDALEIKRQMDSVGDKIRVMTVHGAKGLEAPIVILPDTGKRNLVIRDQIITGDGPALWRTAAEDAPQIIRNLTEDIKAAELAERDRLLYVAMTRAEKWLIVAAAGEKGRNGDTWYEKIEAGLNALDAQPCDLPGGTGLRLEYGNWAERETDTVPPAAEPHVDLAGFFTRSAPKTPPPARTLSPSDLGGAKALAGDSDLDEDAAKRRGRQIHRLLEFLPPVARDQRASIAAQLLSAGAEAATGPELAQLLEEVERVLDTPALAPIFAADALTEVAISAPLDALGGQRIHGAIDRLIITDGKILAVDFKTNRTVPDHANDVPDGILRQMGAYAHGLQSIYPDHRIETAILWTRKAVLMGLPQDLVNDALIDSQIP